MPFFPAKREKKKTEEDNDECGDKNRIGGSSGFGESSVVRTVKFFWAISVRSLKDNNSPPLRKGERRHLVFDPHISSRPLRQAPPIKL